MSQQDAFVWMALVGGFCILAAYAIRGTRSSVTLAVLAFIAAVTVIGFATLTVGVQIETGLAELQEGR